VSSSGAIRRRALLASAAALALLAGCGTPAVIKPSKNPFPGFSHDIQAARNVANELQSDENAETGPTQ